MHRPGAAGGLRPVTRAKDLVVLETSTITAIALGALAAGALGFGVTHTRRRQASAVADDAARARFVEHFAKRGVAESLLVPTFAALRARRPDAAADVEPEDHLARDLGLDRLDLEDIALVIVTQAGGRVPRAEDLDRLDTTVATVDDLVGFLSPFCTATPA
jgi:hypothetical protein